MRSNAFTMKSRNSEQGFTLLEVMLSVLILGVGLLGVITLQARSLQYNQQAYLYSQASFLANDIAERMRANSNAVDAYQIDFDEDVEGVTTTKCLTMDCDANDFALWDLKIWKESIEAALPSGDGSITKIGDQFVISTQFDDSRGNDALRQISITVQI